MSRDLNESTDQRNDGGPAAGGPPRRRVSARVAAVAGLSAVVFTGVVATAVAAPSPAQTGSFSACLNEAVNRITAEAATKPADQRSAYIQNAVADARARCGAILTAPTTTTTVPPTTTTVPPTTTTVPPTTTTVPPTSTTTPAPGSRYEVVATGVIGPGRQTLTANCNAGDRLVSYSYEIGTPTGSSTSRTVNVNSTGSGVTVTYEVTGTVRNPQTSLTAVCRARA